MKPVPAEIKIPYDAAMVEKGRARLKEKKQAEEQRKRASQAIAISCESENRSHDMISALKNKKKSISTKKTN